MAEVAANPTEPKMTDHSQPPPPPTGVMVPYAAPTTAITPYPQPCNPTNLPKPNTHPSKLNTTLNSLTRSLAHTTKRAESATRTVYNHFRTGTNYLANATTTTLSQTAKLLTEGGYDRTFDRAFGPLLPGEFLHDGYACYLSTTSGPVTGTLFVSNRRVAYSSDYPLRNRSVYGGKGYESGYYGSVEWRCYYRVVFAVEEVVAVNSSANSKHPEDRYLQVVTKDGRDFWFMGFVFYEKAFKCLRYVLKN